MSISFSRLFMKLSKVGISFERSLLPRMMSQFVQLAVSSGKACGIHPVSTIIPSGFSRLRRLISLRFLLSLTDVTVQLLTIKMSAWSLSSESS